MAPGKDAATITKWSRYTFLVHENIIFVNYLILSNKNGFHKTLFTIKRQLWNFCGS